VREMLVGAAAVLSKEGRLVMTKLSRAVIACISAITMLLGLASIAGADTFTYELNGSFADSNGGPSLVPYGGTLTPNGYNFGVNEGLSLSGTGAFDNYSIHIHFSFDNINASFNGYERILDFKNRALDEGLYNLNGRLVYFVGCCSGLGGPNPPLHAGSSPGVIFASGQSADLLVTRSGGVFSASVNGVLAFSFSDPTGLATFSGPDNIIYFFMDDFQSLQNFPNNPEAGTGLVDFIQVTTPTVSVPRPRRRCRTSRLDLGKRWPSHLVATAAKQTA